MLRWLVLLGLVLGAPAAIAAPSSGDAAKRLFDEGRALAAKGKHLEACVLFDKSYELEPAVGTQLNLADCAERDGKPRKAWLLWIAAAEEFERGSDARAKFARGRADALAKKLATIVVRLEKPRRKGLVVTVAGRAVKPAREVTERVEAGTIEVTVTAPCCKEYRSTVSAEIGREIVVEVGKLERLAGAGNEAEDEEPVSGKFWRNTAIGGGVAMLVFGGATLYSMRKVNELEALVADGSNNPDVISEGERWATIANVSLVGFGVASTITVVAIVKVLTAKPASNGVAWHVTPMLSPHGAGASLGIVW